MSRDQLRRKPVQEIEAHEIDAFPQAPQAIRCPRMAPG